MCTRAHLALLETLIRTLGYATLLILTLSDYQGVVPFKSLHLYHHLRAELVPEQAPEYRVFGYM